MDNKQVINREVEEIICLSDDDEDFKMIKIEFKDEADLQIKPDKDDDHSDAHLNADEKIEPGDDDSHSDTHLDADKKIEADDDNSLSDTHLDADEKIEPDDDNSHSDTHLDADEKIEPDDDDSHGDAHLYDDVVNHKIRFDPLLESQTVADKRTANILDFYKRCNDKTDRTRLLQMKFAKYYKEYQCEILRMRIRRSAMKLAQMTKNSRQLMLDSKRLSEQKLLCTVVPELLNPNPRPNPFWE